MSDTPVCPAILPRLWVYTNFDCNLQCRYCVARSSPRAERRGLAMHDFRRLVEVMLCGEPPQSCAGCGADWSL